jgi:cell wall integrity and stress response component
MAAIVAVAAQSGTSASPQQPTQDPSGDLNLRSSTPLGCFSNPGDMWDMGPYTFQSNGWCQALCVRQSAPYFGLVNGTNCFCGTSEPDQKYSASSSECDTTCNGFDAQDCKSK